MPGITPDESLPDLSTHVTLRDSTFYRVTYSQQLITMNRQSFRARRNQFADVSVSNKDCSTCITSLIVCSTGKNDIITSDAYCSLIGNCFHTVEASEAIVRLEKHGQSNLFLAQNNNHVEEFSIVGSLPEDKTCALGQGISTEIDADIEACEELADTLSCPLGSMYLHSEKAESSPDDAGVPLTNTDAPVADEDTPSDNAANTATSTTTDSTTDVAEEEASPDDVGIPLLPLLKRHPGCTQFDPCDRCTGGKSGAVFGFLVVVWMIV